MLTLLNACLCYLPLLIRSDNQLERKAYEAQVKKDRPELLFFEDTLGLTIQGRPSESCRPMAPLCHSTHM